MRLRYPDDEVVARSELIIVGGLQQGSIRCVTRIEKTCGGRSFEYHATLRGAKVLKGKTEAKELPMVLRHGLVPAVGGVEQRDRFALNLRALTNKPVPQDPERAVRAQLAQNPRVRARALAYLQRRKRAGRSKVRQSPVAYTAWRSFPAWTCAERCRSGRRHRPSAFASRASWVVMPATPARGNIAASFDSCPG